MLSEERERQGLSRVEAAQRLHMSAYQIEALEIGDYTRLPKGTFLRGFVRNYSRILGLDPDAMLARLAQVGPQTPAPDIVVPSQNIRFDPLGERLANPYVKAAALAVVVVALAFAAMYWWLFIRPTPPASPSAQPAAESGPPQQIAAAPMAAPEPVTPTPAPTMEPAEPATPAPQEPRKAEPRRAEPPKADPARAEARKAGSRAERVIRLRFRGESWVEIRDGEGKVLLSRLNAPGSEAEVSARTPFSMIVGNAPQVDMVLDDREFPLEPHTKVAVARFTVE